MKKLARQSLSLLVSNGAYMTARELSEVLGVSRRALLYSLDTLDDELVAAGLSITERVTNKGIRIVPAEIYQAGQLLCASAEDEVLDFTNPEDRSFYLLFSFLCIAEGVTTERLAEQMCASTRTVSNDVSRLRDTLRAQNLDLVYDKKDGYAVKGNVFTARNLFVQWMDESCMTETPAEIEFSIKRLYELAGCALDCRLTNREISQIFQLIPSVLPNRYTKKSTRALLLHLIAAIICGGQKGGFGFTSKDKEYLKRSVSFDVARIACLQVQEITGAVLDDDEPCYLATLLQSMPTNTSVNEGQNYPFEVEVIVQKMIIDVSEAYQYDFTEDSELFDIVVGHVIPLVYRVLFNAQNKNPLLGEIAGKYARLNEAVRAALVGVESYVGASVTDDECSFLTLYFASSMEKMSNRLSKKARVVVVCNAGNAVSRLIQYKLTNAFNVDVVMTAAEADVYEAVSEDRSIDLVVSVVDLDQIRLGPVQYLKVDPLLSDGDMNHLRRKLRQRVFLQPEPDSEGASLLDLLAPSCFAVLDEVDGMDGLIEAGGKLLSEAGLCDEKYPSQMVSAAHCFGPLTTILIAPGIIMPHAGISDLVFKTGFSFVRVRAPVEVNGKEVNYALSLCTRNKRINQRAIQQFGLLLGRSSFLERVQAVETYDMLARLINECLKEAERK